MESAAGRADEFAEPSLFARKATGLVRGWSVRDAFIYAFFSINLVTLGFFIFTYAVFIPDGSLFWAVLLSGGYLVLQAVTYASLVAAMPRAGGDYIWISRTLGGGIGFVLAACGWWFILWHWVPIYAQHPQRRGDRAAVIDHRLGRRSHVLLRGQGAVLGLDHHRDPRLDPRRGRGQDLRPDPEVLLLRRADRARIPVRPAPGQLEDRLHLGAQHGGSRRARREGGRPLRRDP